MTEDNRTTESLLSRRELAEKATPGPWNKGIALRQGYGVDAIWDCNGTLVADTEFSDSPREESNAAHIAANDPSTVMADIDEILRLRAQVERLEKEVDWLADRIGKMQGCRFAFMGPDSPCDETCRNDCVSAWREAARKAVEEDHD